MTEHQCQAISYKKASARRQDVPAAHLYQSGSLQLSQDFIASRIAAHSFDVYAAARSKPQIDLFKLQLFFGKNLGSLNRRPSSL